MAFFCSVSASSAVCATASAYQLASGVDMSGRSYHSGVMPEVEPVRSSGSAVWVSTKVWLLTASSIWGAKAILPTPCCTVSVSSVPPDGVATRAVWLPL